MAKSDKEFAAMAISMQYLTQAQAEEGLRLVGKAKQVGLDETLAEVLVKKGYLNRAQEAAVTKALNQPRISRIGKYHLVARIGQGGMGTVYKAKQESLDKIVALKVMAPSLARQSDFVTRFIREAQASGKLNHPNVVLAIDAGEADGYYYFAMEFVDGESLKDVLDREGKIAEKRALEVTAAVVAGLQHAHDSGIVHRDIKPANVFLTKDGTPKLGDLGLAKEIHTDKNLTQAGIPVGTPYYISPEQARGLENVDGRADLYAVGAMLYRMVAGDVPYEGPTGAIVMTKHLNDPIPDPRKTTPGLSEACVAIIHHCMQKRREDRYKNARQLQEDVALALAGKPLRHAQKPQARAAQLADRMAQRQVRAAVAKQKMLLIGGGAAVLLIAVVAIVIATSGGRGSPPQAVVDKTKLATAQPVEPKATKKVQAKTVTPTKTGVKADVAAAFRALRTFAAESDDRADVEKRLRDFYLAPQFAGSAEAGQAKALLDVLKARWKAEDDFRTIIAEHIKQARFAEAKKALDAPPLKEKTEKAKALLDDLAAQVKRAGEEYVSAQAAKGDELLKQGDLAGAKAVFDALATLDLPEATAASEGALRKLAELAAARERRAAGSAFANAVAQAAPLTLAGKLQEARALFGPAKAGSNKTLAALLKAGEGDVDRLAAFFDAVAKELADRAANREPVRIRGIGRLITRVEEGIVHCAGGTFPIHQLRAVDLAGLNCAKGKEVLLGLVELYRGDCAAARTLFEQHAAKPPDADTARWLQELDWVEALSKEGVAHVALDDPLLAEADQGAGDEVEAEARRQAVENPAEEHGHDVAHHFLGLLLLGVARLGRELLLDEHHGATDDGQDVHGAEERVGLREVLNPEGEGGLAQLDALLKGAPEADEDGNLEHDGQAAAHRVHPVGLVQFHHLFLLAFLVALEFLADFRHLGLKLLHLLHRGLALLRERVEDESDDGREDDDGDAVVGDDEVGGAQHPGAGGGEGVEPAAGAKGATWRTPARLAFASPEQRAPPLPTFRPRLSAGRGSMMETK